MSDDSDISDHPKFQPIELQNEDRNICSEGRIVRISLEATAMRGFNKRRSPRDRLSPTVA